jgi:hypothetical protein
VSVAGTKAAVRPGQPAQGAAAWVGAAKPAQRAEGAAAAEETSHERR